MDQSLPLPLSERYYLKNKHGEDRYKPEEIQELLDDVTERLAKCEVEYYKKGRGRHTMQAVLRAEAPSNNKRRRINLKVAWVEIRSCVYRRHALQHGGKILKDFNQRHLLQTFLGKDAPKLEFRLEEAKLILMELWNYGKSQRLVHLRDKLQFKKDKLRDIEERQIANKKRRELEAIQEDEYEVQGSK